jgi:DNA-nicking Smr family endonuclease
MAKKRKKRTGPKQERAAEFSHRPFAGLALPPTDEPVAAPTPAISDPVPAPPDLDDDETALAAMTAGTAPLAGNAMVARRATARPLPAEADDAALVMRELDDLVHGVTPFDFSDTDEYIEAAVQGLDRRLVRRLRRGELAVEAHLDLHGCNRREARALVAEFVGCAHAQGKRCVLIVHGRGLGSKDNIPVLKQKLASWLTRGAIGRRVLAYTSARPYDGGTGAVYVLLRA